MLGVLQQFLYYNYQKFDHKVATVFAILFHFKFYKILPQVAGEMVTESVIPVNDAYVVQHNNHFHRYTLRLSFWAS